jgi:exosortase B
MSVYSSSRQSSLQPTQYPLGALFVLLLGLVAMYAPSFQRLFELVWSTDEQGHGPLILAASFWLLWDKRKALFALPARPALGAGSFCLFLAAAMYVVGHSQAVLELEGLSFIFAMLACMLLLIGPAGLRLAWFPLVFMLFMVPLPGTLVQMITLPLKQAVSVVSENLLYWAGYPIGRTGVTLTIGPYQLLVADACSGLNSLFTLESLGLLYMNIMHYKSKWRNGILAVAIVPISFIANVIRVITLVLVTYYFGDEAGQGFVHEFAGLLLFAVAMVLIYGVDRLLAAQFDKTKGARHVG